jgi:hypothetical protein
MAAHPPPPQTAMQNRIPRVLHDEKAKVNTKGRSYQGIGGRRDLASKKGSTVGEDGASATIPNTTMTPEPTEMLIYDPWALADHHDPTERPEQWWRSNSTAAAEAFPPHKWRRFWGRDFGRARAMYPPIYTRGNIFARNFCHDPTDRAKISRPPGDFVALPTESRGVFWRGRFWLWGPAWQRRVDARLWSREADTWSQSSARGKRFTQRPTYWWLRVRGQLAERAHPVGALTRGSKGGMGRSKGIWPCWFILFLFIFYLWISDLNSFLNFKIENLNSILCWGFHTVIEHIKKYWHEGIYLFMYIFLCIFFSLSILFYFSYFSFSFEFQIWIWILLWASPLSQLYKFKP